MRRGSNRIAASALRRVLRASLWALLGSGLLPVAGSAAGSKTQVANRSLINLMAPEFARPSLNGKNIHGPNIDLEQLRGKVVLLNFWATWCAPCRIEMPVFSQWQSKYGREGLQVIGISMDDDAAPVRKLLARLNLSYPVAMGDAHLGRLYGGVLGLPLTFVIDRRGVVRARYQGESNLQSIEKEVRLLLDRR